MKVVALRLPDDMKNLRRAKIELAAHLANKNYDFVKGFLDEVIIETEVREVKR